MIKRFISVALVTAGFALQAAETNDATLLTLDRIFVKQEFKTDSRDSTRWLNDNSGYTTLESATNGGRNVVRYEPERNQREVLVPASALIPPSNTKPLGIEEYTWSEDGMKLLIFTNSKRVWRKNTKGDYWVYDLVKKRLQKLGGNAAASSLMFATLSPDGKKAGYVRENNLYVQNLESLRVTQLTKDGSETIINGTSDWVYEEELYLRNAFRWSPDSQWIAYWQFDTSGEPIFSMINNTEAFYPKVTSFAYPKTGQTNATCKVGIVPANGGRTRWIQSNPDPRNHYIPEMTWTPDSKAVVFQQLNRLQNTNQLIRAEAKNGETRVLMTDRDDAWVEAAAEWHWLGKSPWMLWESERDGWRHLYRVSCTNTEMTLLTPGEFDVTKIAGIDTERGWVYFLAAPDKPTERYLYRARLEGSTGMERISPKEQPGTHSYDISKDCRFAFHTYSRFGQPPRVELVRLPEHTVIRTITDNSKLTAKLKELKPCASEFFRVEITNGVTLDAWCIKPPDFDASRRYPVLFYVYGEPAGQTVADHWGGDGYLWNCLLAQQGYLVMSVDNRGTAAPRGRDWRKCIYRQVGILASADQAAAVRKILEERPYVDPARIGIWGWSGGGSMTLNAILRYPDLYRTAMAVAFVSNQRYYDTIYQERYMGLPSDNGVGYTNGSPITFARQLKGNLLLVHGTADDNVHYQNCEAMINALIKNNKQFTVMPYPNRTHGISEGEGTRLHLYETLTAYLKQNLPAGPQGASRVQAGAQDDSKPSSRTHRNIEGWTVRIDDRLLSGTNEALGARCLKMLEAKLADIKAVVAPDRLEKLRGVPIVLDLSHGKLRSLQYHPSPEWLEGHGYAQDLAKCVHIPEAADFPKSRQINEQPWVVLHELAHAYHDQVLNFDNSKILRAYEKFKTSGHGDATLLYNGKRTRHYALTDHKEFFAEMTEAYFGLNDFFPFTRAELMTAEPEIYELMREIWGPIQNDK